MITYNDIDEARRKEKVAKELQKLPENFIEEVSAYLKEKKDFSSKNIENFSEDAVRAKKQFENARTLFKELILRRREKILDLLFIATETGVSKRDFENMLVFEKKMFDEMIKCIESTESQVNALLNEEKTAEEFIRAFTEDHDIEEQRKEAREILGVEPDSLDLDLINRKYKELAKEHHPDMGGNPETFKAINRAHKMLKRELE